MSPVPMNRRAFLLQSAIAAGALTLTALAVEAPPAALASTAAAASRRMRFHGTGFQPMIAAVTLGETLRVESVAARALRLVSAPTAPQRIERLVEAGRTVLLRPRKPGLYLLYDDLTTRFDPQVGQVAARSDSPFFPMPAYAVVLVTDRAGGGVALTGADVNIPDTTMTFQPWAVVCEAATPVRFTNNDMDAHVLAPTPEPQAQRGSFDPLPLPAHGGTGVVRLAEPGLYHYYCPVHARYRPAEYTFEPLRNFGGFPFVMDGVIAVMPAGRRAAPRRRS